MSWITVSQFDYWVVKSNFGEVISVSASESRCRLISAAPELLEACKRMNDLYPLDDVQRELLTKAINKAEGKE